MRGGKREGAGRPSGARNKRTRAVEAAMEVVREKFEAAVPAAFEGDGVAFLQVVYRDPANPIEVRIGLEWRNRTPRLVRQPVPLPRIVHRRTAFP